MSEALLLMIVNVTCKYFLRPTSPPAHPPAPQLVFLKVVQWSVSRELGTQKLTCSTTHVFAGIRPLVRLLAFLWFLLCAQPLYRPTSQRYKYLPHLLPRQ